MDEVLAILRRRMKASGDDELLQEIDAALAVPVLRVPIRTGATAAWLLGARSANQDFGITPGIGATSPDLDRYIEGTLVPSVDGIHAFTRKRVRSIVSSGLSQGIGLAAIYAEVASQRQAGVFSLARAGGIGRYESENAFIDGRRSAVRTFAGREGKRVEKRSVTVGDDRVEEICEGNERAGWIPEDEAFPSGHDAPLYHNRCRCDLDVRLVG